MSSNKKLLSSDLRTKMIELACQKDLLLSDYVLREYKIKYDINDLESKARKLVKV